MIWRASARAASTQPRKVSVMGGRFGRSASEGVLPAAFAGLFLAVAALFFLNSVSTAAVEADLCGATRFLSSPVVAVHACICLPPYPRFCMFASLTLNPGDLARM